MLHNCLKFPSVSNSKVLHNCLESQSISISKFLHSYHKSPNITNSKVLQASKFSISQVPKYPSPHIQVPNLKCTSSQVLRLKASSIHSKVTFPNSKWSLLPSRRASDQGDNHMWSCRSKRSVIGPHSSPLCKVFNI